MFFGMQKYIYSENVFNTLYIQIKHKSQKTPFGQNERYKNVLFFFRELQLITVLLLICDS